MTPRGPDPAADLDEALALIRPDLRTLPAYRPTPRGARHKLNQNESPYPLPPALREAVLERLASVEWNRYPEAVPRRLTDRLAAHTGWLAEGILVGAGSNDLLASAIGAAVGPGDAVVAPAPTYAVYRLATLLHAGRYRPVPLASGFRYEPDAIVAEARRERARVVILCAPNNPTGTDLAPEDVRAVLEGTDGFVFVDEAYREFGGRSALELLPGHPRLVVFRTLSKAFGAAGLRLGYALAHPAVVAELRKARLPYAVNAPALAVAEVLLERADEAGSHVADLVAERGRMQRLAGELPGLEVVPSATNFFLVRTSVVPPRVLFERLRDEHSVLVRDVSGQPGLEGYVRISVGTAEDTDALVAGLRAIVGPGR
ncbi:MAG TPA: histidinol-phosphate transaminase [Gemmatimonadales bacterium]|nr:histidinol-phosphate transaminase [Gemmatimonadales bacterium]